MTMSKGKKRELGWAKEEWTVLEGRKVRLFVAPASGELPDEPPLRLPLLLIHGLGCTGETWEPTLLEMRRRDVICSTLAPDLPGFGRSEGPYHDALGMEALADWVVGLLDQRGIARTHLAGNSMGCQVALALARRHGDRVGGIVLQGPTTGERIVPAWRYVTGLIRDTIYESPAYTLRLMKMYTQMGPRAYAITVKKMLEDDPFAQIREVRAPCLVIRGGNDAIVSDRVARRLAAHLPDAIYLPLDHAAHAIEYNNPEEFVDAMLAFLARAERTLGITQSDSADCSIAQTAPTR
ncbi:MAG: alpha/beta hydrolase [Cytophagales bacterium]|nr:alpha/beta hydrolase [Armatimonadota bacterium]